MTQSIIVYIVRGGLHYEGGLIIGVCKDIEDAKKTAKNSLDSKTIKFTNGLRNNHYTHYWEDNCNWATLEEVELK